MRLLILAICVAVATAQTCPKTDRLSAVDLAFKSHEDHAVYGTLVACPPEGYELSLNTVFKIFEGGDDVSVELDPIRGSFVYIPPRDFSGIQTFHYTVEDDYERSKPAKVTISMSPKPEAASLQVSPVFGYSDDVLDVNINTQLHDTDATESPVVCMCNCDAELRCDEHTGDCYCHLTLPKGWQFWSGETALSKRELHHITQDKLTNLKLKPGNNAEPQTCLDIHAVSYEKQGAMVQHTITAKQLHISVLPREDPPVIIFDNDAEPVTMDTTEGRPIQFTTLKLVDGDDVGIYRVQISIDQGGSLWVKQQHPNVVFTPQDRSVKNVSHLDNDGHELGRDESFYDHYNKPDDTEINNGKKFLEFTGSMEAVNEVLSSLVYVPWCAKWPTPPSWQYPENSWMEPAEWDQVMTDDIKYPIIWPEWYPRFWYPFPSKTWYWWPRVWAPYWLDDVCTDWTTNMQIKVREVTPPSCSKIDQPQQTDEWSAALNVKTRTAPKSLITRNHFTYFDEDDDVVTIQGLYIRSLEKDNLQLRFNAKILEDVGAWVENTDSFMPTFGCDEIEECNRVLQQLQVHFHSTKDICKLTVEIEMYKGHSNRLADLMTVWVYKTKPECVDSESVNTDFRLVTEPVQITQGQRSDLDIRHTLSSLEGIEGLLHVKLRGEFGLVSVPRVPKGLRVYMDHMGVHEQIPTKLCMAGPVSLVLKALETAQFTPLKDFIGNTHIEIEYGITTTGSTRTYGYILPKRTVNQYITVLRGSLPRLPLLMVPRHACIQEGQTMPLNFIKIDKRFQEVQTVKVAIQSGKGKIELGKRPELKDTDVSIIERDDYRIVIRGDIPEVVKLINEFILYKSPVCYSDKLTQVDSLTVQLMNTDGETDEFTSLVEITCEEREHDKDSVIDAKANKEKSCLEEDTKWKDWSECSAGVCGIGVQSRHRKCGDPDRQERPCVKCDCDPVSVYVKSPSASLSGCDSVLPIKRCPDTCQPIIVRYEDHEFYCTEDGIEWVQSKPTPVHQNCLCKSCTKHQHVGPRN